MNRGRLYLTINDTKKIRDLDFKSKSLSAGCRLQPSNLKNAFLTTTKIHKKGLFVKDLMKIHLFFQGFKAQIKDITESS